MRPFESHDIDGIGSNSNKDKSHGIEIERSPVVFDEHIGVSGDEDNQVNLLSFVADANNIFVGQDLEEKHEESNQM